MKGNVFDFFFLFEDCLFHSKIPFQKVVGNPSPPPNPQFVLLKLVKQQKGNYILISCVKEIYQCKTRAVLVISLSC